MPTYSYACTECGKRFDAVQAFTDNALTECPQCSGRLRKLFGKVGVVFKGSGFYRTDSRAGSTSNGETKKATADSSSDTAPTTKSETKSNGESKSTAAPAAVAS